MKHITLICAGGMSSSILVKKMQDAAARRGEDVSVIAMSESAFSGYKEPTDVLLLGPQVSYLLEEMKKSYEPEGIRVGSINLMTYGQMNGEAALDQALAMLS